MVPLLRIQTSPPQARHPQTSAETLADDDGDFHAAAADDEAAADYADEAGTDADPVVALVAAEYSDGTRRDLAVETAQDAAGSGRDSADDYDDDAVVADASHAARRRLHLAMRCCATLVVTCSRRVKKGWHSVADWETNVGAKNQAETMLRPVAAMGERQSNPELEAVHRHGDSAS